MKTATLILGLGILVGCFYGDERRRRKYAQLDAQDLNRVLDSLALRNHTPKHAASDSQLKKVAAILNDAHKHIRAVSKALLEPAR